MRIDIPSFRGMAPRTAPRNLPANAAQSAINARVLSGDLEAWAQFLAVTELGQAALSIYLLNDVWLSWTVDVDVARGLIPGDTTYRVYLTGPEVSAGACRASTRRRSARAHPTGTSSPSTVAATGIFVQGISTRILAYLRQPQSNTNSAFSCMAPLTQTCARCASTSTMIPRVEV